jgi:hypothetical protein
MKLNALTPRQGWRETTPPAGEKPLAP